MLIRRPSFPSNTGRLGFQVLGSDAHATAVWLRDLVSRASTAGGGRYARGTVVLKRSTESLHPPTAPFFNSLVCGFALSLIGAICFVLGQITLFATLYTLGVVCSLVGTGFLLGFWKQCKMMMDPVRIYAAGEFLLSLDFLKKGGGKICNARMRPCGVSDLHRGCHAQE